MLNSDDFQILYWKKKMYIFNISLYPYIVFTKMFIKSYTNKYNNLVFRQKKRK